MAAAIHIDQFEGPLDLLLHLIEDNKVDILDIPIAHITAQYNEIIAGWARFDMDDVSDYLLMAARLMQIKSQMLLPQPRAQQSEDPRAELAAQLAQYAVFKRVSAYLQEREAAFLKTCAKDPEYLPELKTPPPEIVPAALSRAMRVMLEREHDVPRPQPILMDAYSVEEQKERICRVLQRHASVAFEGLFEEKSSAQKIIVTLLAVLELYKLEKIDFTQDENHDIILTAKTAAGA